MKSPFTKRTPYFDAHAISETIQRALAAAGLGTTTGPLLGVTETIRRALRSAEMPTADAVVNASGEAVAVAARNVDVAPDSEDRVDVPPMIDESSLSGGSFDRFDYASRAGARAYKLYVPSRLDDSPPPLIVMLHGCTQSADDFAAGTRMNQWAEARGFLVVYPEQASSANPSKCWNWFKAQDQVRDGAEPSLIAGMVIEVAERHGVDKRRIFIAGLSAGAAMAVILGETYPELFAGVGAHSGLPYRSASDVPSALAAMKGGRSGMASLATASGGDTSRGLAQAVPTIVFHGDRDHTVQQTNGIAITQQASDAHLAAEPGVGLGVNKQRGKSATGRSYSRSVYADAAGRPRIESWTVHGAGHAWAGGSKSGSYTDSSGPDASAEMVRFFLSLPRAGSA